MRVYKFLPAHFALKSLYEGRLRASRIDELNDPFELLPFDITDEDIRLVAKKLKDHFATKWGILSFSAAWSNPAVWAHYADKHFGICLGFEIKDTMCLRVTYVKSPISHLPTGSPTEVVAAILGTKYESWRYEDEVRVWGKLTEIEDGSYYMEFGESLALVEVIAGIRCTVPKSGIERAIGDAKGRVKITKARAGYGQFEVIEDPEGFK